MGAGELCRFGVLTASDRASNGEYEDLSGPAIEEFLRETLSSPWKIIRTLVPDEKEIIEKSIIDLIEDKKCSVILTTG